MTVPGSETGARGEPVERTIERVAEAMWQDESLRVAGYKRRIDWTEEGYDTCEKWRRLALVALTTLGPAPHPPLSDPSPGASLRGLSEKAIEAAREAGKALVGVGMFGTIPGALQNAFGEIAIAGARAALAAQTGDQAARDAVDAARYRWLRDRRGPNNRWPSVTQYPWQPTIDHHLGYEPVPQLFPGGNYRPGNLDAAIDRALREAAARPPPSRRRRAPAAPPCPSPHREARMSETYASVLPDIEEALRKAVRAFAEWHAREGQETREHWRRAYEDPMPEGDWLTGYNAGVESVLLAVDLWLEELL